MCPRSRRRPARISGVWPTGDQPVPPQPSSPWQAAASVVIALTAVFSVIAQSADNPVFAWALIALALLVLLSVFFGRVTRWGRDKIHQARRNRVARQQWPEFLRLAKRFGKFVSREDSSNLRQILFDLCGNNNTKLSKLCPPDYLNDFYELFFARYEAAPAKDEQAFSLAVDELNSMVSSYNKNYVLEPLRRLKEDKLLFEQCTAGYRERVEQEIEGFRERWVRFLDDFKEFLDKANNDLQYDPYHEALGTYFERPAKL